MSILAVKTKKFTKNIKKLKRLIKEFEEYGVGDYVVIVDSSPRKRIKRSYIEESYVPVYIVIGYIDELKRINELIYGLRFFDTDAARLLGINVNNIYKWRRGDTQYVHVNTLLRLKALIESSSEVLRA